MSAVKKKKRNGNKTLYIILFVVILVVLAVTFVLLPKNTKDNKPQETELEETYDTQNFDDTKAPKESSEDITTDSETLPPLEPSPEELVPASFTEDSVNESSGTLTLNVKKPVFSSDEYGENALRLNELIELKTDEIVNEYAKTVAGDTNGAEKEYGFSYEVYYNDKGIVSILYHTYINSGEESDKTYGSINYDMNAGNTMTAASLFGDEVTDYHTKIADNIVAAIAAEPDKFTVTDETQIRELYTASETQFVTDQTNITVYFQPGELAEAANGLTKFTIPVESIN